MLYTTHSIAYNLGRARDQGPRPTCLMFAISDLNMALNESPTHRSVEYLCHHAQKRIQGWKAEDSFTYPAVMIAIRDEGQPDEDLYPYEALNASRPLLIPPFLSPTDRVNCKLTIVDNSQSLENLNLIISSLKAKKPLVLVIGVTEEFMSPIQGVVADTKEPAAIYKVLHAVVVVALGELIGDDMLMFQLRNSWGQNWGELGYAWVSELYLERYLRGVIEADKWQY